MGALSVGGLVFIPFWNEAAAASAETAAVYLLVPLRQQLHSVLSVAPRFLICLLINLM